MDLCVWHEDKVCKGEGDGKDGWYLYRGQCMLKIDLWSELFYGLPFTFKISILRYHNNQYNTLQVYRQVVQRNNNDLIGNCLVSS